MQSQINNSLKKQDNGELLFQSHEIGLVIPLLFVRFHKHVAYKLGFII